MNEMLQSVLVAAAIAAAALYLLRRWRRTVAAARPARGPGCGGDCCGR